MPSFEFKLLYTEDYTFSIGDASIAPVTIWKVLRANKTFRCKHVQLHDLAVDESGEIQNFDDIGHSIWPATGSHTFTWEGTECEFVVSSENKDNSVSFIIHASISTDAEETFLSIMDALLKEHKQQEPQFEKYVSIWNVDDENMCWYKSSVHNQRSFDTIYIPTDTKRKVLRRIDDFIESHDDYESFGMPYKLVGLLEGPSGTGKTSFIHALASKYERDIAILTITSRMTNATFVKLVAALPKNCFLVIEDIDCLFDGDGYTVTFSTLLNVLDGANSCDGMIAFVTTCFPDNLESSLVRPGRVDFIATFDFAKETEIRTMLEKFVPDKATEFPTVIEVLRQYNFTVATLQKFLFEHRNDKTLLKPSVLIEFKKLIRLHHADFN